jgi:hypothetical protein
MVTKRSEVDKVPAGRRFHLVVMVELRHCRRVGRTARCFLRS